MNYIDYCSNNANKSLDTLPLTELDFAIFSELVYFPFDSIVSTSIGLDKVSFNEVASKLLQQYGVNKNVNPYLFMPHRIELLKIMKDSTRYQDIKLHGYKDYVDETSNFTAIIFEFPNNIRAIAFRGTTDSVIGWREDFELTYLEQIKAQAMSANYLVSSMSDKNYSYYLTGHSKGANLAVYSALSLDEVDQDRISHIYAYDGPGFDSIESYETKLAPIKDRISHYIPHFSIIGLLLNHSIKPIIVQSDAIGLFQHLTSLWKVDDSKFIRTESVSAVSHLIQKTAQTWLQNNARPIRERYFTLVFDLILQADVTTFLQINDHPLEFARSVYREYNLLPREDRLFVKEQTQNIIDIGNKYYQEDKEMIAKEHKYFSRIIKLYDFFQTINIPFPSLSNFIKRIL